MIWTLLPRSVRPATPRVPVFPRVLLVGTLAILSGCNIAPYDQTTDQSLTDIQKRVDGHIAAMKQVPPGPATQPGFYDGIENDLHVLVIRNESRPQNDASMQVEVKMFEQLAGQVNDLKKLERISTTRPAPASLWDDAQRSFDTSVKSILTLELQRKK
jgi:hypothetical protein